MNENTHPRYDVVVIGGGPAGLSAAVALARSRRSVVVVDSGEPRNAPADGVHNLLGHEGIAPAELHRIGRTEVEGYGGRVLSGRAVGAAGTIGDFTVNLDDGSTLETRRLIVTTGLVDTLPDVAGIRERWGKDVVHCPYCHGWEIRDRAIGVLGDGPMAGHQALMFRQLSDRVTLFRGPDAVIGDVALEQLTARGVAVVDGTVESLLVEGDALAGVALSDGSKHPVEALAIAPHFAARASALEGLGLEAAEHPSGLGTHVASDPMTGATALPGVWAAGNVTDPMAQVVMSAAAGLRVGAVVNADLIAEEAREAVAARAA
jgi:thioredoxin reductase